MSAAGFAFSLAEGIRLGFVHCGVAARKVDMGVLCVAFGRFDANGKNLRRIWLRTEQKARRHNDLDEPCMV